MIGPMVRVGSRPGLPILPVLGLLVVGAAVSSAVALGRGDLVVGAFIAATALVVGLYNWRWSVYGVLAYLPFSGIPILFGLPNAALAALLKDLLFIVPAYVGYILGRRRKG